MLRRDTPLAKRALLIALSLLMVSAGIVIAISPGMAHAFTNAPVWTDSALVATCGLTQTTNSNTATANDPIIVEVAHITTGVTVTSITDTLGNSYQLAFKQTITGSNPTDLEWWYTGASLAGADAITVNFSGSVGNCIILGTMYDTGPLAFNVAAGAAVNGLSFSSSQCTMSVGAGCNFNGGTISIVAHSLTVIAVSANLVNTQPNNIFVPCIANQSSFWVNTGQCTFVGPWTIPGAGGGTNFIGSLQTEQGYFFATTSQSAAVGSAFIEQTAITPSNIAVNTLAINFASTGVFFKSTAVVETLGCGTSNSTTYTLPQNNFVYILAQADPKGSSLANVSAILASVTTATATLVLGVYVSPLANNSVPSAGNQFKQVFASPAINIPVTSTKQLVSTAPNVAITGYHWYAIGIAQTDSGTGVVKLRVSATAITVYNLGGVAVANIPTTLTAQGTTVTNHAPCIFGFAINTPVVVTLSGSGGGATTITNVLNQASPTSVQFWLMPFFYLCAPAAILMAVAAVFKYGPGSSRRV